MKNIVVFIFLVLAGSGLKAQMSSDKLKLLSNIHENSRTGHMSRIDNDHHQVRHEMKRERHEGKKDEKRQQKQEKQKMEKGDRGEKGERRNFRKDRI